MPLFYPKLSTEMIVTSAFNGVASKKFFDGISAGIVRSVKELASVTIAFSGNAGSPGRAFIHGISSSSSLVYNPLVVTSLVSRRVAGAAAPYLASAISRTADDLRTDAEVTVSAVTFGGASVANGTGILSSGGIMLAPNSSADIIAYELKTRGIHDHHNNLTDACQRIVDAVAESLSRYLLTLTLTIPVVGGSPSSGTAAFPMTGKFIT